MAGTPDEVALTPAFNSQHLTNHEHVDDGSEETTAVDDNDNDNENANDQALKFHARTWLAVASMFLLNLVQIFALLGPSSGLSYIEKDLQNTVDGAWIPNALSLVQAVVAPLVSSAADTFQARKVLLVVPCTLAFVGCAIAPGASTIYRVIGAQILIGFGFSTLPLAYSVPSEILPRKWRPMVLAGMNIGAALGACAAPLIIGALTKTNAHTGWRNFYWIEMALWGSAIVFMLIGYQPPKRHTQFDHLTLWQKLGRLDLPGSFLLAAGLTLLLVGINSGGRTYPWVSATVLTTIIFGALLLVAFGIFEWKFTKTGILHHDLFSGGEHIGRSYAIAIGLVVVEAVQLFGYLLFFPILTSVLWTDDPLVSAALEEPFWIGTGATTMLYGYWSSRFRTVRWPLFAGFLLLAGGMAGLATIQPADELNALIFAALCGMGFGSPLIMIIATIQLLAPHRLIATTTAVAVCLRGVFGAIFTAIFDAAYSSRLDDYLPKDVGAAALKAGLPSSSIDAFVKAISAQDTSTLSSIPGVTSQVTSAGMAARKQAYADAIRIVFIIAAPFAFAASVTAVFLGHMRKAMDDTVQAPIEELHAKSKHTKALDSQAALLDDGRDRT